MPIASRILSLTVAGLLACTLPAEAQIAIGAPACFGRAYSPEHMAAHPGQRVTEMLVTLEPVAEDDGGLFATIRAMMRDRFGEFFANSGYCRGNGDAGRLRCSIDCDGGQFEISLDSGGTATLVNEISGFVLFGGCGDDAGEEEAVWIPADAEHAAFRLYPLPMEACPHALWQAYDVWRE